MSRNRYLFDNLESNELAVFCGAGISKNSGLPLANELKQYALEKLHIDKKDLGEVMNSNLPFEAFMETISENTDISRILEIFENGEPNTNHILIARLAKNGYLKTIFTTNFDLLIEKALKKEGLSKNKDFVVYYDEDQFSRVNFENHLKDRIVRIFKIHGSVDDKYSIRTTMKAVASKILSDKRMDVIRYLFSTGRHKKVLILGYSCSDEFDITPQIQSIYENQKKIIFVEHSKEGDEIRDVKIKERKNPFKTFPGSRIRCDTDDFVRDLWVFFNRTIGTYEQIISEVDWKMYLDDWAKELKEGYRKHVIVGLILHRISNFKRAIEYHDMAIKIAKKIRDKTGEAECYINLGVAYHHLGHFRRAITCCERGLEIKKQIEDKNGEAECYIGLGNTYSGIGDFRRAIEYYKEALEISKAIDNKLKEAACYGNIGNCYYRTGNFKKTIEYYERTLQIDKAMGSVPGEGVCYIGLGNAYYGLGDYKRAIEYYERDLEIATRIGNRQEEANCYTNFGNVNYRLENFNRALEYYKKALEISKEIGDKEGESRCNLGLAYQQLRDFRRAIEYCKNSLEIAKEIGAKAEELRCYIGLGASYGTLKNFKEATDYYKRGLEISKEIDDREGEATCQKNLGDSHYALGDFKKAIECYSKAGKIFEEIGQIHFLRKVCRNLALAYEKIGDNGKAEDYKRKLSILER